MNKSHRKCQQASSELRVKDSHSDSDLLFNTNVTRKFSLIINRNDINWIGKVLNSREPKIVNGPEVLDKFVGGSEGKIRELFAEAEAEQAQMGDNSMLHIIIFDEMDAIMKKRGSTSDSTGVNDSVVNQLLSKIDGVDSLNNILIIGMTNRYVHVHICYVCEKENV